MGEIRSYRDLIVWQKSKDFSVLIYKITERFPKSEIYGLSNQLRRAAVSIPSNIAEGFRRKHLLEKLQFLRIAFGSGAEIETQLCIAKDLNYIDSKTFDALMSELDEIMRITNVVINKLQ